MLQSPRPTRYSFVLRPSVDKLCHGAVVKSVLSETVIQIHTLGPLDAVAEIGAQLAWMGAANGEHISYTDPRVTEAIGSDLQTVHDDFSYHFILNSCDLVESGPHLPARKAAIGVLTNDYNLELKLRQKAVETSEEETIGADGVVERVTKRKIFSQDGVGFKIKGSARRQLEGFDFKEITEGRDPLFPRVATLALTGVDWVDFARAMHAITLFGRGFGEIFKPSSSIQICTHWSAVPKQLDYLTAANNGAIIFGHNRKLSLRWPDISDPVDGDPEYDNALTPISSLSVPPLDSGIGSSIGSVQSNGQSSADPQTGNTVSKGKKRGNPFRRSRNK
ncbi:hypothetical protein K458DRAFT_401973 [Lentithecium fluviatile CBS 122367]|uniref:Uncharacterized protein n=1 Tax=Lentithecium fluviatile CBS 122367 TaxID=1168545 RepID=A0A6G1JBF0_9PLEO|nr:hypothetical protein K458DRAFT_401973 [Lentithecium fluviatile CBS 122367]